MASYYFAYEKLCYSEFSCLFAALMKELHCASNSGNYKARLTSSCCSHDPKRFFAFVKDTYNICEFQTVENFYKLLVKTRNVYDKRSKSNAKCYQVTNIPLHNCIPPSLNFGSDDSKITSRCKLHDTR